MQANVGDVDRIVRIVIGLALLSLLVVGEGPMKWLGLIGIVPIATALLRRCPVYRLLGTSTCGGDKRQ